MEDVHSLFRGEMKGSTVRRMANGNYDDEDQGPMDEVTVGENMDSILFVCCFW